MEKKIEFTLGMSAWFWVVAVGKHHTRFLAAQKTRATHKPRIPDTPCRDKLPVLTEEEEIKRGEAGDPLLLSQMAITFSDDKPKKQKKAKHKLWIYTSQKCKETGKMVQVPSHNLASGQANSSMRVPDTEAGIYLFANTFVQKRYDIAELEVTSSLPPTIELIEKYVDAEDIEEPMRSYTITKLQDKFNLKFLSFQANVRACWNTINHTANVEHQEFHLILADPRLKAILSYPHYQRYWHVKYGDFSGTKYAMFMYRICIV